MKKPKSIDDSLSEFINECCAETRENSVSLKRFLDFERLTRHTLDKIESKKLIKVFTPAECKLIKYRAECNEVEEIRKKMCWTSGTTQNKIRELADKIINMAIFDCPKKEPKDILTWVYNEHKNFFGRNRRYFDMNMDLREHKKLLSGAE